MNRPEFKQYDEVIFQGLRSKIVSVNPTSKTFNVRTPISLAQNVEAKDIFETYDEWKAANPDDPLVKPVDLLAWHKPPVAPRPTPAPKTPDKFDYSQLAQDDQIAIRVQVSNIKTVMKRTAEGILTIGESLTEVQDHLAQYGHGKFQEWLKAEFEWSLRTAYRFMQVYKRLGVRANLAQMDIAASALYELADPETPDEVINVVVGRAEAGESIERKDVIEAKEAAAQPEGGEHVSPLNGNHDDQSTREEMTAAPQSTASVGDHVESSPQIESPPESRSEETDAPITTQSTGRQKPKTNRASDEESPLFDRCQTPPYALIPLIPYIDPSWTIWEPAAGKGRLVEALVPHVARVSGSDILTGEDFMVSDRTDFDAIITNPPYSKKYDWLKRCYELGKPFALLIPGESLFAAAGAEVFEKHGIELLIPKSRIDFDMPEMGFDGDGAQFPTAWFTWGFNIGKPFTYVDILKEKQAFKESLKAGAQ